MPSQIRLIVPLALVLAACTDAPPGAPTAPGRPAFDLAGAPASSGQVLRFDSTFSVRLIDHQRGLMAYLGRDIVAWCQGDPGAADTLAYHDVVNPVEPRRILRNMEGDVHASVWTVGPSTCARYLSETPIAAGISRLRYTDNDITPNARPDPANTNAWGWMAQGILVDAAGGPVRFTAISRATFDGVDASTTRQHVDIMLR